MEPLVYAEVRNGVAIFKSNDPKKKYMAMVRCDIWNKYSDKKIDCKEKPNGVIPSKKVYFGDASMEHFKDTTGLNLFSHLDHLDPVRRKNYYARNKTNYHKYSADWFSKKYLW